MHKLLKDRTVNIIVDDVIFSPGLNSKHIDKIWHMDEYWEYPKDGEIIIAIYENKDKMIVRVNSDLDTDEIIGYAYINDLV